MNSNPNASPAQWLRAAITGRVSPANLLGVDPDVVVGAYELGRTSYDAQRFTQARALFLRCVLLEPTNATYWLALAAAHHALNEDALARQFYRFAAVLGATDANVLAESLS